MVTEQEYQGQTIPRQGANQTHCLLTGNLASELSQLKQSIESLSKYMLVSSSHVHVDVLSRQPDGRWLLTSVSDLKAAIALADLYENIELRNTGPTMRPAEK